MTADPGNSTDDVDPCLELTRWGAEEDPRRNKVRYSKLGMANTVTKRFEP